MLKNCKPHRECCGNKQEVGDDLSVCVLNLLLEVSTLLSLVAINLVKGSCWTRDQRIVWL